VGLRVRLVGAFLALGSLLVLVSAFSVRLDARIQHLVAQLRTQSMVDLEREDLIGAGLEVTGLWDADAQEFVATDLERLPTPRRPKIRGVIEAADPVARTITLFGAPIAIPEATESDVSPPEGIWVALQRGRRVEISCRVGADGTWIARKVRTQDVKQSDKLKGTVTRSRSDGNAPDTLEIDGYRVNASPRRFRSNPASPLWQIERASQMASALQECRIAAHEVLGRWRWHPEPDVVGDEDREGTHAPEALLVRSQTEFERVLDQSLTALGVGLDTPSQLPSSNEEVDEPAECLHLLLARRPNLRARIARFRELAHRAPDQALDYLDFELDPFLQSEMLPVVQAYRQGAERRLASDVRNISSWADAAMWVVLATSAFAVALAILLGTVLWRSISTPLRKLHEAALAIGRGHFDTRVEVHRRDELGALARALNTMVEELATTTVSIAHLEGIIDSMASALILTDPKGRVTRLNRAALQLLGPEAELLGRPFASICSVDTGRVVADRIPGDAPVPVESTLQKCDGSTVHVALSHAPLFGSGSAPRGFVYVAQDLTERRQIEARIRNSLADKELLLREVHHRVKNNLQVISSLLDLQSSVSQDQRFLQMLSESQNRVRSIALIHEQLYQSRDLARIELPAYLERLTIPLMQFSGRDGAIRLRLDIEDMSLDIDQTLACGLIVTELATNALKHAFPGERGGEIRISARVQGNNCRLTVADDGRGLPESIDAETVPTLGLSLVANLVRQLQGTFEIRTNHGSEIRIEFPDALRPVEVSA